MRLKSLIFLLFIIVTSCEFFKKTDERIPIARVNNVYLYQDDIKDLVSEGTSIQDSTLLVQNFIKKWATRQLFFDGALLNLSEEKQQTFNKLVDQYKNDLYTKAYIDALVRRSIDTIVSIQEAEDYYNNNKEAFKLNEELIKFRYINVDENIIDFKNIEKKFETFNEEDKKELDSIAIQFKSYSLNDSIWIRVNQVIDKIPALNTENKDELLKKI